MIVFIDTTVLGAIVNPSPKSPEVQAIQSWARQMEFANHRLIVPAIVDYEQRREHLRRHAIASLTELDFFIDKVPGRYLEITDSALKKAAQLWAEVRQRGLPTADVRALDCDILLAAQVLDLNLTNGSFTVATDNIGHLSRVVPCQRWNNILP